MISDAKWNSAHGHMVWIECVCVCEMRVCVHIATQFAFCLHFASFFFLCEFSDGFQVRYIETMHIKKSGVHSETNRLIVSRRRLYLRALECLSWANDRYFDYAPFSWICNCKTSLAAMSAALLQTENGNCLAFQGNETKSIIIAAPNRISISRSP